MTVIVCSAQVAAAGGTRAENLEKSGRYIEKAAEGGAGLVCFPEQFSTGWNPVGPGAGEDRDGPTVTALREYAKEYGIAVLGSFVERYCPRPRNTAFVADQYGEIIAEYSKIHLFSPGKEDQHYAPGEKLSLFTLAGMQFGIAVCYDIRFSEIFSIYAECGAGAVLVPAAWPSSRLKHWELFIRSRALENQFYIVGINEAGREAGEMYCGGSLAADPDGSVISRGGVVEELIFTTLDPGAVREARERIPVRNDRKSDLYHKLGHI